MARIRPSKTERAARLVERAEALRVQANDELGLAANLYYEDAFDRGHRAALLRDRADDLDAEAAVARSLARKASDLITGPA